MTHLLAERGPAQGTLQGRRPTRSRMCPSSTSDTAPAVAMRSRDAVTTSGPASAVRNTKAICRHVRSAARDGQLLPQLSVLLVIHSFLHAAWTPYSTLDWDTSLFPFGTSNHLFTSSTNQLLRHISLALLVTNLLLNIAGYGLIYRLYQHSVSTIFNRIPPQFPSSAFVNSFGAHIALLRPLEIIFRYLTARFRVLPDVIVLGEVRCGTTTLGQHLSSLPGCHQPFCLWKHPELDGKETFYFVGHYLGNVDPSRYRMCFPLKITKWWNERILKRPFFTFDGCAQYLTSPTAAALIAETYRRAGQDPPVLVACVRSPVDQAISWWRYENNAIEWGASMGLTDWNTKLRTNAYPPRAIGKALEFANSTEVQRLYSNAADLVTTKTDSKCLDSSALATQYRYRLPPWAMTWPGGQLSTIGRNGKFCFNISRFETIFAAVFAENANVVGKHTPKSSEEKNGKKLQYVSVVPLECMSAGSPLADALASIMEQAACRRYFNSDLPIFFDAKESLACIDQSITTQFQSSIKVRRNSGTKLSNLDMEPTSEDEVMLSKYFEKEMESLSRLAGLNFMCDGE